MTIFRPALRSLALVVCCTAAPTAATAVTLHGKIPQPETQTAEKLVFPPRTDALTIDWVDPKSSRISIGGITYALRNVQPRITLADGIQATHVGYLRAGQTVRIVMAPTVDGMTRLAEIHVVGP